MTIADQARNLAISLEAKKDALRQMQNGDWKVSFTVQAIDMIARLTQAPMGTRFAMVLVEIGDDETPVNRKEAMPNLRTSQNADARPDQIAPKPDRAKRDWRDVQPAAQAGIRSNEPEFWAYLREVMTYPDVNDPDTAAIAVRHICKVNSRTELSTDHRKRVLWHQLDSQFQAWLAKERVGA